jgi:hypothetical protein
LHSVAIIAEVQRSNGLPKIHDPATHTFLSVTVFFPFVLSDVQKEQNLLGYLLCFIMASFMELFLAYFFQGSKY